MTSKRDVIKRDLGPLLAIAGGVVVLGAVTWGFIAVGGPGDARARRIDDMTLTKVSNIATLAQCAVNTGQDPPKSLADIRRLEGQNFPPDNFGRCNPFPSGPLDRLGDIEYSAPQENRIRICATFLRPSTEDGRSYGYGFGDFPELKKDRPAAGHHCYDIRLIRPLNPLPTPDPVPAPPPFR
jgi:hypothetical protein